MKFYVIEEMFTRDREKGYHRTLQKLNEYFFFNIWGPTTNSTIDWADSTVRVTTL